MAGELHFQFIALNIGHDSFGNTFRKLKKKEKKNEFDM